METKLSSLATHCIKENNMDYFVYTHQDSNKEVFYVGKGRLPKKGRSYRHSYYSKRSDEWESRAKDGYTSQILTYGSERDMFYLEKHMIKSLTESGMELCNKLHNVHYTPAIVTEETKRKISKAKTGVPNITWRNDKSSELYKQTRRKQREEFYKQKEAA